MEAPVGVAVVEIDSLDAADDVGDVGHLAPPLADQSTMHVLQQLVVLARLARRRDQVAGDAL